MKKVFALVLALAVVFTFAACSKKNEPAEPSEAVEPSSQPVESSEPAESSEPVESSEPEASEEPAAKVLTHAEYIEAALDTEVTVETYVQAKQSWWEDKATVYTQDEDGAYFLYQMACSEEDYDKLVPGTKIRVTGYKSEWSGEVEIVDSTFEIIDGNFIAEPLDVTDLLGKDELIDHQNEFVSFSGLTIEASKDGDGKEVPFLYNWDGSGQQGDDLYFNVSVNGATYNFTVESYLCDSSTDVYKAVEAFNIGDTVDLEGFLYWYEGANPHITAVK